MRRDPAKPQTNETSSFVDVCRATHERSTVLEKGGKGEFGKQRSSKFDACLLIGALGL